VIFVPERDKFQNVRQHRILFTVLRIQVVSNRRFAIKKIVAYCLITSNQVASKAIDKFHGSVNEGLEARYYSSTHERLLNAVPNSRWVAKDCIAIIITTPRIDDLITDFSVVAE
jgi:hypothetical protein